MNWKLWRNPPVPRRMLIRNETRDSVLAQSADVADTSSTRRRGLRGFDNLPAGRALWIVPCESVHTCRMRFPIDVLYLHRNKRVLKAREVMVSWRLSMCFFAHSVIELPAGVIEQTGTRRGDQLILTPP